MKNLQDNSWFHFLRAKWETLRYSSTKGFTLIELLVVVVFIAIVSGILIPKLLAVYDRSGKTGMDKLVTEKQGEQVPEKLKSDERINENNVCN